MISAGETLVAAPANDKDGEVSQRAQDAQKIAELRAELERMKEARRDEELDEEQDLDEQLVMMQECQEAEMEVLRADVAAAGELKEDSGGDKEERKLQKENLKSMRDEFAQKREADGGIVVNEELSASALASAQALHEELDLAHAEIEELREELGILKKKYAQACTAKAGMAITQMMVRIHEREMDVLCAEKTEKARQERLADFHGTTKERKKLERTLARERDEAVAEGKRLLLQLDRLKQSLDEALAIRTDDEEESQGAKDDGGTRRTGAGKNAKADEENALLVADLRREIAEQKKQKQKALAEAGEDDEMLALMAEIQDAEREMLAGDLNEAEGKSRGAGSGKPPDENDHEAVQMMWKIHQEEVEALKREMKLKEDASEKERDRLEKKLAKQKEKQKERRSSIEGGGGGGVEDGKETEKMLREEVARLKEKARARPEEDDADQMALMQRIHEEEMEMLRQEQSAELEKARAEGGGRTKKVGWRWHHVESVMMFGKVDF